MLSCVCACEYVGVFRLTGWNVWIDLKTLLRNKSCVPPRFQRERERERQREREKERKRERERECVCVR